MAEHTYTPADLNYIYGTLINGGAKIGDIPRILKNLGPSFTLSDLKTKANLKGLSSTSQALWNQALSTMGNAEAAAGAPGTTATKGGQKGGTNTQVDYAPPGMTTGQPKDIVSDYMAPTGPATDALTQSFLRGGGNSSFQDVLSWLGGVPGGGPGSSITNMLDQPGAWNQQPFMSAPGEAEQYMMSKLLNLQPTAPSGLEQLIGRYTAGGPMALVNQMTPPASSFENNLALLGTNPYLAQIAAGRIPQTMTDALNAQLALGQKQTMEAAGMGGALTSSDFAEGLARAQDDARTKFLSDMAQQAQGAQSTLTNTLGAGGGLYGNRVGQGLTTGANLFGNLVGTGTQAEQARQQLDLNKLLGLANPLLSTQAGRGENALTRFLGQASEQLGRNFTGQQNLLNLGFQGTQGDLARRLGLGQFLAGGEAQRGEAGTGRAFQDYASRQGMPPELQALLALLGAGGSTTKTTGTGMGSQGMGGDLLGALGSLGGGYLAGGGSLAGLFGGGGAAAGAGLGAGEAGSLLGAGLAMFT